MLLSQGLNSEMKSNFKKINIISVVGARPNFMKMAPVLEQMLRVKNEAIEIKHYLCHTGQHYDKKMSDVFFKELELPKPDIYLGVGSGSHTEQTAKIMIEFEKVLVKIKPDLVLVYGDVNSTAACSLVAVKLNIKVAHIESGLRSFDRTMPEEINRVITDSISDYLFVTEKSGYDNLIKEGVNKSKIFFVGNTMIDSLVKYKTKAGKSGIFKKLKVERKGYALITLHRPANVDEKDNLKKILQFLNNLSRKIKIVFPVHPRTQKNINIFGLEKFLNENIILCEPIGYIDFLALTMDAKLIVTDSGGIQEESTYLKVPCITLRQNTERPSTVEMGTNILLKTSVKDFLSEKYLKRVEKVANNIIEGKMKVKGRIPEKWDGRAGERIVSQIVNSI